MANKNRDKGIRYELEIRKFFTDLGWTCLTSRYASKKRDDEKVDLCDADPFLVQCKFSDSMSGVPHKLIKELPDEAGMHRLLFHKRSREGTLVAMELDTFKELIAKLITHGAIDPKGTN